MEDLFLWKKYYAGQIFRIEQYVKRQVPLWTNFFHVKNLNVDGSRKILWNFDFHWDLKYYTPFRIQVSPLSRDVSSLRTLFLQLLTKSLSLTLFCKIALWIHKVVFKDIQLSESIAKYVLFCEQLSKSVTWLFYHIKIL